MCMPDKLSALCSVWNFCYTVMNDYECLEKSVRRSNELIEAPVFFFQLYPDTKNLVSIEFF